MRFLRSIQLDGSDQQVYHRPATAGEWAVPGQFALWDIDPDTSDGKTRQAFRHGFVGTQSFGHTTLVVMAEIEPDALTATTERIVQHLIDHHGAPSAAAARPIAEQEIRFTLQLCDQPAGTLLAVERTLGSDGVEEQFRIVKPSADHHDQVKLWGLVED